MIQDYEKKIQVELQLKASAELIHRAHSDKKSKKKADEQIQSKS